MKNSLKTIALLALIPIIALAVSIGGEAKMNHDLHSALRSAFPDVAAAKIDRITIQDYLARVDDAELGPMRTDVLLLSVMKVLSIVVLAFTCVFMAVIRFFGLLSRKSRQTLLRLFKPAYLTTSLALAAITIVNAGLLIGAIYFGESLLISRVHIKLIFLIGAGAIAGCFAVLKSMVGSFKREALGLAGTVESESSGIGHLISSVSEEIGSARIDNVISGDAMTFFATEGSIDVDGTKLEGKTVYLSRPICEYLSVAELKAIVTHELGHFKGQDTEYSVKFNPIYRGLGMSIAGLESHSNGAMAFALLPTRVMFNYLLEAFALSEKKHGRERELAADLEAAKATDPLTFSTALLKTSALLEVWQASLEEANEAAPEDGDEGELALKLFHEKEKSFSAEGYQKMLESEVFHPYDSHPSVKERILALGQSPEAAQAAIDFEPKERASSLFEPESTLAP